MQTQAPLFTPLPKELAGHNEQLTRFKDEIKKVIVGNDEIIDFILVGLLCQGHILLEGVPGVGKTLMVKAVNKALGLNFKRIQFTPDLLPSDLLGTLIFNVKTQEFETKKGPIFSNLILADEINRAPAKVQAALLESMQEQQVTIGSTTYCLDKPFIVFATQNPLEQEGTYRLPEAQIDRFMFKLIVHYPSAHEEKNIIHQADNLDTLVCVMSKEELFEHQHKAQNIYVDPKIIDYIVTIISALRTPKLYNLAEIAPFLNYGVSSRATLALHKASKAHALLQGRHFVIPDDVKAVAIPTLAHRLSLSYEAEAQNIKPEALIQSVLNKVVCP